MLLPPTVCSTEAIFMQLPSYNCGRLIKLRMVPVWRLTIIKKHSLSRTNNLKHQKQALGAGLGERRILARQNINTNTICCKDIRVWMSALAFLLAHVWVGDKFYSNIRRLEICSKIYPLNGLLTTLPFPQNSTLWMEWIHGKQKGFHLSSWNFGVWCLIEVARSSQFMFKIKIQHSNLI